VPCYQYVTDILFGNQKARKNYKTTKARKVRALTARYCLKWGKEGTVGPPGDVRKQNI